VAVDWLVNEELTNISGGDDKPGGREIDFDAYEDCFIFELNSMLII